MLEWSKDIITSERIEHASMVMQLNAQVPVFFHCWLGHKNALLSAPAFCYCSMVAPTSNPSCLSD